MFIPRKWKNDLKDHAWKDDLKHHARLVSYNKYSEGGATVSRKRLDQAKTGWTCRRLLLTLGGFFVDKIEGIAITTDGKMFDFLDNDRVDDSF